MRLRSGAIAVCAGNACAYAIVNTSPLVLGALMAGLRLDAGAAGALMSAALMTMGLVALACAPLLTGARTRRAAFAGACVIAAGESAAALSTSPTWMFLWMLVIGIGAGVLIAAVNAIAAAMDDPQRLFGYALTAAYALAAVLVSGLAPAIDVAGHQGAFAVLAAFTCVTLPLLRGLPQNSTTWAQAHTLSVPATRAAGYSLLAGIVLIGVPMMGFYAYIEALGVRRGLPSSTIALVFAAQQLASVIGALLAARAGLRLGLMTGIALATLLHTAAIVCAVLGAGTFSFAVGVIAEGFSFLFLLPVLFTLAALLDASGRWAAAANGALFVATGVAPFAAGLVINASGYDALAWSMLVATWPGLWAFSRSVRALDRMPKAP